MIAMQKRATAGDRNVAPNSVTAGVDAGAKLILRTSENA
jgi:hypothetical protein